MSFNKKVVTGKVRASYVNVFRPRMNEMSNREEYSMVILIPKTDTETIQKIEECIEFVKKERWGKKIPSVFRNPLRDGDVERPEDEAYQGHYFMNLKSTEQPGVVDKNLQEIFEVEEFLSGDYCRVAISCYSYDVSGNKGVSFGLGNIQVLEKGDPLSVRSRPQDDFKPWKMSEPEGL